MEIQELEGLVQEFYESAITNERRYEIQYKLKELGSKPNVIRWALGYIASDGASEFVGMQALTVVEVSVVSIVCHAGTSKDFKSCFNLSYKRYKDSTPYKAYTQTALCFRISLNIARL